MQSVNTSAGVARNKFFAPSQISSRLGCLHAADDSWVVCQNASPRVLPSAELFRPRCFSVLNPAPLTAALAASGPVGLV